MPSSLSDYEVLKSIGSGTFGTCKKIRRKKDGKILVWKELDYGCMREKEKQLLVSEVNLLRELRHQHIVRYYDRVIDRATTKLFIVMEYCEGGDLASLISQQKKEGKRIDESFVWRIGSQIVQALKECHTRDHTGKKVLHRDIKPANVFLDKDLNAKLGDFGLARVLNQESSFAQTYLGTPYYMSPEQINFRSYNEKSDIWALGCLLYELCALNPPFTANALQDLASKISTGRFARIPFIYTDDLNSFIGFLLQVEEQKRPTVEMIEKHATLSMHSAYFMPRPSDATPIEGATSAYSTDEGYSSKVESLTRREEALTEKEETIKLKEQQLQQREKKVEERENSVALREKLLTDLLDKRSERRRESDVHQDIKKGVQQSLDESSLLGSLRSSLANKDRPRDSGSVKKQVSFILDKENDLYSMELPAGDSFSQKNRPYKAFGGTERQFNEYTCNMMDIQQRLKQARRRSCEFKASSDLSSRVMGYR